MKRSLPVIAIALLALVWLAPAAVQAPKKPDIIGTWVGYAISPGTRFELTAVFDKAGTGYTGKLSDASGMIAETPLREIVFKDNKLTFEFDLDMGGEAMFIKIELTLENEVLKGFWFDVEGNSDVVELALKK
jgi:hypothetical protein